MNPEAVFLSSGDILKTRVMEEILVSVDLRGL